ARAPVLAPLSLHAALPICAVVVDVPALLYKKRPAATVPCGDADTSRVGGSTGGGSGGGISAAMRASAPATSRAASIGPCTSSQRSGEHTSEIQPPTTLLCH